MFFAQKMDSRKDFVIKMKVSCAAKNEDGVALIMVLGVLTVCMLLISHMLLVSEVIGREALVVTRKSRLRYQAESAADMTFWMHLTDRRLFSNRRLGQREDDELRSSQDFPPWMLDRRPHLFDNGLVTTWLSSAEEGFKVGEPDSLKNNISIDDSDLLEEVNVFLDILGDYIDVDDLHKLNGMEADHYAADGFPTLPRNAAMEFKAEVYWLPGWRKVIPGEIAVVPPPGLSFPTTSRNARPSFFSASDENIRRLLDLTDSELEEIQQARKQWEEEGTALEDALSTELWSRVLGAFNFTETNLAQVSARASEPDRSLHSGYRIIREANLSRATCYSDKKLQTLAIWERMIE